MTTTTKKNNTHKEKIKIPLDEVIAKISSTLNRKRKKKS